MSGAAGDQVILAQANGGVISRFVAAVDFRATFNGQSLGQIPRTPNRLAPLAVSSLGEVNGAFEFSDVVLSEVHYHPVDPNPAALAIDTSLTDNDLEFVEIYNPMAISVDLTNWRLRREVDFNFANGQVIASGETIVVVAFDPVANTSRRDAFRAHYGIGAEVALIGPFSNSLSNSYGVVQLLRPDSPPLEQPTLIPRVLSDEVYYDDKAPWPTHADGGGASLQRIGPGTLGSIAASWVGEAPTPGRVADRPAVEAVTINGGEASRSHLTRITVQFDREVQAPDEAFLLTQVETGAVVSERQVESQVVGGKTISTITFLPGPSVIARANGQHSLVDGFYQLEIVGRNVLTGENVTMGPDHVFGASASDELFRFYGDTDGDGDVDALDYVRFAMTFLKNDSAPEFNPLLDYNGDLDVDAQDFAEFAQRFLSQL